MMRYAMRVFVGTLVLLAFIHWCLGIDLFEWMRWWKQ